MEKIIINCDVDPSIPGQLLLLEHERMGIIEFDFKRVKFMELEELDGDQIFGLAQGHLRCMPLNANVLDRFLANPEIIPEKWENYRREIYFLNTTYHAGDPVLKTVRSMKFNKEKKTWNEGEKHLYNMEFDFCLAILYKNEDYIEIQEEDDDRI